MKRSGSWLLLAALGVSLLLWKLGGSVAGGASAQRNFYPFDNMAQSQAAESFSESAAFPNGQAMQAPPAGTVARGLRPLRFSPDEQGAKAAGKARVSPYPPPKDGDEAAQRADEALLARGRQVFEVFCTPCHGPQGNGDGEVARRGMPPPPSLHTARVRGLPDGHLFHIVTFGQNNMPGYAAQIDRDDRWKVIRYLRVLSEEQKP